MFKNVIKTLTSISHWRPIRLIAKCKFELRAALLGLCYSVVSKLVSFLQLCMHTNTSAYSDV